MYEFFKEKLSARDRILYEKMLTCFSSTVSRVDCTGYAPQEIFNVYRAVYNDHAELFYLSPTARISQRGSLRGAQTTLNCEYIFPPDTLRAHRAKMLSIADSLEGQANLLKSEREKELLVCDYLIENVFYEINDRFNQNAATALVVGKGQCSGISKAAKYLFDRLNIPCLIVEGSSNVGASGKEEPHSWNIVRIDGKEYHLDVTFLIGQNPTKQKPFRYPYFNGTDEAFSVDHKWDRTAYPTCSTSDVCQNAFPQTTSATQSGLSRRPSGKAASIVALGGIKAIYSVFEFRLELKRAFDERCKKFTFLCKIRGADMRTLSQTFSSETEAAAKRRHVALSYRIEAHGNEVTMYFTWL